MNIGRTVSRNLPSCRRLQADAAHLVEIHRCVRNIYALDRSSRLAALNRFLLQVSAGVLRLGGDPQTEETIKRTLSALSSITQGVAELRGQLGSGHGHHPSAGRPSPIVARLAVGSATTLGVFLYQMFERDSAPG